MPTAFRALLLCTIRFNIIFLNTQYLMLQNCTRKRCGARDAQSCIFFSSGAGSECINVWSVHFKSQRIGAGVVLFSSYEILVSLWYLEKWSSGNRQSYKRTVTPPVLLCGVQFTFFQLTSIQRIQVSTKVSNPWFLWHH
jgi:hypothetical protein